MPAPDKDTFFAVIATHPNNKVRIITDSDPVTARNLYNATHNIVTRRYPNVSVRLLRISRSRSIDITPALR